MPTQKVFHDFSLVFHTQSPLWQRVLDIFAANDSFPRKKSKGRALHHKFPRSFSKKFGEPVDNSPENLISLTPADHFRVHYYYYILARKGFRQSMALAFNLMVRAPSRQISPATMECMALDYELSRREEIVSGIESATEEVLTDVITEEELNIWRAAVARSMKRK